MKRFRNLTGVALVGLAAATVALGQKPAAGDEAFVTKAAVAGMTEVEASKVALQKSSDAQVKSFAQHMIDDHTKAGDALKSAASQAGITAPGDLDAPHKLAVDKLKALSGVQFDEAYKSQMLKDHKEAVSLFQGESKGGSSPVEKFAADTLPTLQTHLKMAQELSGGAKTGN